MADPLTTGVHDLGVRTLDAIVRHGSEVNSVGKKDVGLGDYIVIETRNSSYTMMVLGDNNYSVSGGWFDRQGLSPMRVSINGCTWGGTAIKHDIVAAPGLFLEFSNQVKTTRIQQVRVVKSETPDTLH
jgi:hypothetical protein